METILGRGWNLRLVVVGLGAILVTLLVTVIAAHQLGIGATRGKIDPAISAQITELVSEWEGTPTPISVEGGGDRYTLTSGRIVLLLRSCQSGVSSDEQWEVQDMVEARARIELGEPSRPTLRSVSLPTMVRSGGWLQTERVAEAPIVAYGFAICDDWVGIGHSASTVVDYAGGATAKTELTRIHHEALEWFRQQLVSQHGRQ